MRTAIEIVNQLLDDAIARGVSDVHLEPTPEGLRVRMRHDGLLIEHAFFDQDMMPQIISRCKVLAAIDIAQKRLPQDGMFQRTHRDQTIDLRVSTFPTQHGQKVVIRVLDPQEKALHVGQLGMQSEILQVFCHLLERPQGFFLVTGPTGSGKTTTLYAGLSHINSEEKNIITLEDPIEYQVPGITQGHVHPEIGFTFQAGMRALLRQDPDIVMIGEVRDPHTARTSIQAAMTGHLVLSTLHTNDAPSAIVRLMDMGVEPFLINASLSGVLAQRLVRTLCASCKRKRCLSHDEQELCMRHGIAIDETYEPVGCDACFQLGHKGRIGIFELILCDDAIRALISSNPSMDNIAHQAQQQGMLRLVQDGLQKVKQGSISFAELLRIVY